MPLNAPRQSWFLPALGAGIAYLVIGRVFAWPVAHVIAWRWAAWFASGLVFAMHIGHEHFRVRNAPRTTALHTATGVAIGGFGLAVVGMLNSFSTTGFKMLWLVALVAWPAITAIPAFVAAFVVGSLLTRSQRSPVP